MKHLGIFILGALLLASCATNKRAAYIQQVQTDIPTAIEQDYQIRIKPLDRLTVTINSKDPELAVPFNSATSYNSLTGTNVSSEANSQSPQPKRSKTRSAKTGWCTTRSSSSSSPT